MGSVSQTKSKLKDEIEKAIPFNSNLWQTFFITEFGNFDHLNESYLKIDLNTANLLSVEESCLNSNIK
jgi:hypothetical protein